MEPTTGQDSGSGGNSFSAPVPPAGGMGNFKGVMLCNRPSAADGAMNADKAAPRPFRSAIPATVGDALGLIRKRSDDVTHEVKRCGPSAALRRHCQWIKELEQQVKEDRAQAEQDEEAQEARKVRMQQVFKHQRDAIKMVKRSQNAQPDVLESAFKGKIAPKKPLWAMTAEESEEREDIDADALIDFAKDLDYDEYIQDMEFRHALQVVNDRAKKLQREQDAFKDSLLKEFNEADDEDDAASTIGDLGGHAARGRRRGEGEDRPDWDGSTVCSDDRQSEASSKGIAERAWEEGSLKGVHSKSSVKKLAEQVARAEAAKAEA
eukprot:TRINITY_DN61404_c0_g1_i1.p1 TRINITY_DN61404_c0_g1~~TRINITY_DN61404_c0_g1_i1.p1  ORF type:complete len:321 (-),score=90.19 TRINITY_DN61404_c0_g1_i1:78-1040(-)